MQQGLAPGYCPLCRRMFLITVSSWVSLQAHILQYQVRGGVHHEGRGAGAGAGAAQAGHDGAAAGVGLHARHLRWGAGAVQGLCGGVCDGTLKVGVGGGELHECDHVAKPWKDLVQGCPKAQPLVAGAWSPNVTYPHRPLNAGVGIVNAVEIVNSFPTLEDLKLFKRWVDAPADDLLQLLQPGGAWGSACLLGRGG